MKIKIKDKENGKRIIVEVAYSCCEKYKCFYPHHWITQSLNCNHTQVDKNYSCGTRNYRGCPDNKELKVSAAGTGLSSLITGQARNINLFRKTKGFLEGLMESRFYQIF
jgi:hypothetical protein